jgi:Fic family protein
MSDNPPFQITSSMLNQVAEISEQLGRLASHSLSLKLRRINHIRSVRGSLAIEGNTLSEQQITAILDGKRVIAPPREILEVENALAVYKSMPRWQPQREQDLLDAHQQMMQGLISSAGRYRDSGVGVMAGKQVVHMAPPASRVPVLMQNLFSWLKATDIHPLLASSAFHYEFEFIHPFADGNGRLGRLWQSLILVHWQPVFKDIPIESIIHDHQQDYYLAIEQSTQAGDSSVFIDFMLRLIGEALDAGINDGINAGIKLTEVDREILELIRANRYISHVQMAEKLSKSSSTIERRMARLKKNGIIERIGARKTGYWQIHNDVEE